MSEFVIQCAVCSENFSKESECDQHQCQGLDSGMQLQIKMECPEEEDEQSDDQLASERRDEDSDMDEEELDVKPILPSTEEMEKFPSFARKDNLPVRAYKTTSNDSRKEELVTPTKKRKRKTKWTKKKSSSMSPIVKTSGGIQQTGVECSKTIEEVHEESKKPVFKMKSDASFPMEVNIKPEPVDLCEIVNVKDEPADYEELSGGDAPDPLANTVQDILGLEDEDYLIENFVEYDEEISNSLEIVESAVESSPDNSEILEAIEAETDTSLKSNVGKRIISTTNRGHGCNICKKRFFERYMLDEHLKLAHRTPRPYACSICLKRFTHKNYVNLHMRVHTGEKPYKCSLCSRSYSHKTSFTIHMRIHKGDRPYECTVCGKKCYDKSGLTSHMRSHTKETPYQCECCGRKFTHSKSLLVHRRNHTGEKPYVCPHCGRAFRHWHKHKIHIRLHTGERPYKCQICNKGFPRNDEVKRHMKSHTGIKSFKCSICGVYCATQASITGHINLHHVNLTKDNKFQPEKTIVEDSQSGILGKKVSAQRSYYRIIDNSSYEEFHPTSQSASQQQTNKIVQNNQSSQATPLPLNPIPQTIVSPRPMTPQEKVNNKSMTYKQFLNDQEQQLLAKGLKVVSKNNNTYGLAPANSNASFSLQSSSSKESNDEQGDSKSGVKGENIDNVFVKVPNIRRTNTGPVSKPATRIILPNYVGNNKGPLMIGEAATKLLLQSASSNEQQNQGNTSHTNSQQQVFIQTVGNTSLSSPIILQQNQQQLVLQNASNRTYSKGTTSLTSTSNVSVTTSNNGVMQQLGTHNSTGTNTIAQNNGSILQAALTGKNTAITTLAAAKPDSDNIIVLNKGMSGGGTQNLSGSNSGTPLVMLSQPVMHQQLLLLPGINGGPARLVLLQPSSGAGGATASTVQLTTAGATQQICIKQENVGGQPQMVQQTTSAALASAGPLYVFKPKPAASVSTGGGATVKPEPADPADVNIKRENEDAAPELSNQMTMPNMIKLEPIG